MSSRQVGRGVGRRVWLGALTLLVGAAWALGAGAQSSTSTQSFPAISKPSQKLELAFIAQGTVLEIPVKEGDVVKVGQTLLRLDDRIERTLLEKLQRQASSELEIRAYQAELASKRVELKRVEDMYANQVASESELEKARLDVIIGEIRVEIAQHENAQAKLDAKQQQLKVDIMELKSPVDGEILVLDVGLGEAVDPGKPVLAMVSNQPLWVEAHLPSELAENLKLGQSLELAYASGNAADSKEKLSGKIIFMAAEVDSASDTRLVRMELANPQGRTSGLQMTVKVPARASQAQASAVER